MILLILFISAIILGFFFIYLCDKKCWDFTVPVLMMVAGIFSTLVCAALIPCERSSKAYNSYYKEWNRKHAGLEARIEHGTKAEKPHIWGGRCKRVQQRLGTCTVLG